MCPILFILRGGKGLVRLYFQALFEIILFFLIAAR